MPGLRYSVVIIISAIPLYIMYSHYSYITSQKNDIEIITSHVQEIKSTVNANMKKMVESNFKLITSKPLETTKNILDQANGIKETITTILIWTRSGYDPLMHLLKGQEVFVKRNCRVKSCFITTDKSYLKAVTEFDVILFNGPDVVNKKRPNLPQLRHPRQNYVFASIESSDYYPICDNRYDGYFNISWTYKLNSDIFYGYIIIRNSEGEIIGPQKEMHWISIEDMNPVNSTIKEKLSSKKKLAAGLISNCNAPSGRDKFVKNVQIELKKLGTDMTVDVYGKCGTIPCARHEMPQCLQTFEQDYYFFFSFENSFSEDYVTEKVLHPLQHYMVPVVYGAANYSRFMPDGTYLNARELGPAELARRMVEIANDKEQYYNFFKWMSHYSFHYVEEVPETDFYCKFCEAMNDEDLMKRTTVIENMKEWWNPPIIRTHGCPPRY